MTLAVKDKYYVFGVIISLTAYLVGVISFFYILFAVPVYLIGAMLIAASKQTRKIRLYTIVTPVFFYVPLTAIFLYFYNYPVNQTVLIPENHEGLFRIVYEEKCGEAPRTENSQTVLQMPENGILIVNAARSRNAAYAYYLVDKNGHRQKLNEVDVHRNKRQDPPYVYDRGSGSMGGTGLKSSFEMHDFYIGDKYVPEKSAFILAQKFDSLTMAMVNNCRNTVHRN